MRLTGESEIRSVMSNNKFYRLIRDCKIKNAKITNTVIDLLYQRCINAKGLRAMDFPCFLTALKEIAVLCYGVEDGAQTEKVCRPPYAGLPLTMRCPADACHAAAR